jgi:hypothetical protein
MLQETPQLRKHPVYIILQIHCKIENKNSSLYEATKNKRICK